MNESQPAGPLSPVRKLMHLAMTVIPAAGWLWSYSLTLGLAGMFLLASLVLEAARRWWPQANRLLWRLLPTTFRQWEDRRVLGSTWLAIGTFVALLVFGRDIGGTAILFLIWGDAAAELVGRRWGRPGGGKTVVGSLGCLVACLVAGLVGVGLGRLSPWSVLAGAVVATLVERRSPPPDDNVWIPILSGLIMLAGQRLVGI
jgi:dolichol kinase